MATWLEEIIQTLDKAKKPVIFFFRDDDAGWADNRLFKLLDCFSRFEIPIDLAVIPQAIDHQVFHLYNRVLYGKGLIGIHQHGFIHSNHQLKGRKSEFGSERTYSQQYVDIKAGQDMLWDYFGEQVDPIFTPPWNRCNQDTVDALVNLGFTALSRDNTGELLNFHMLGELSINIDWFKKRKGIRFSKPELSQLITHIIAEGEAVGIMLHHEIMDNSEREVLSELLTLLRSHPKVKCVRMCTRFQDKNKQVKISC